MALTCRRSDGHPNLSRRRDAVTEVRGRLGHPLVVGDYRSEVSAQPSGSGQMDSVQRPEVGGRAPLDDAAAPVLRAALG